MRGAQSLFLFPIFFAIINAMIRHIIFDFGGVFLDLGGQNGKIHYNLEKVFNISEEKALEIWKEHKEKLIVGMETPEEFLMRIGVLLGSPINASVAHETWKKVNKMEKDSIDWALVNYVESLKKNYKIHMLSNAIDLEPRFPYLDRRMIEFGLGVPPEYKFVLAKSHISHYGSRKMLQRMGFNGIVPPEVLWSQEKIRYGSPVVKRLRQYFNPVFGGTKNIHTADLGIVDVDKLISLASPVLSSDSIPEDHPLIPWLDSILGLEVWLQANYEDGVFS